MWLLCIQADWLTLKELSVSLWNTLKNGLRILQRNVLFQGAKHRTVVLWLKHWNSYWDDFLALWFQHILPTHFHSQKLSVSWTLSALHNFHTPTELQLRDLLILYWIKPNPTDWTSQGMELSIKYPHKIYNFHNFSTYWKVSNFRLFESFYMDQVGILFAHLNTNFYPPESFSVLWEGKKAIP